MMFIFSYEFISFKVILFIFDFFLGYVYILKILRKIKKKENKKEK